MAEHQLPKLMTGMAGRKQRFLDSLLTLVLGRKRQFKYGIFRSYQCSLLTVAVIQSWNSKIPV